MKSIWQVRLCTCIHWTELKVYTPVELYINPTKKNYLNIPLMIFSGGWSQADTNIEENFM